MKRIAIIGGGIAGLAAAYELELARKLGAELDWTLYEASNRLGGTVETTQRGGFVMEGGPDGWVSEKPWARDLAVELGLEGQLIASNDETRKTYILMEGKLEAMPDRMRMMVPEDLKTLEGSTLFSPSAREAYANELQRADELREAAPLDDESVASFVKRHFGEEVLEKIAAPLLCGVFGGDVAKLSVGAVMPGFVAMEREHGSLIAAVQAKAKARGNKAQQSIFTSLRNGMGSLVEAIVAKLPTERVQLNRSALSVRREGKLWCLRISTPAEKGRLGKSKKHFSHVLLATPADVTSALLEPLDAALPTLIPQHSSSAVLAAFCWPADSARAINVPQGFGFLVPQSARRDDGPQILACTFVDQKFPNRTPSKARLIRVFFGGTSADEFAGKADQDVAGAAFAQLENILGKLPAPDAELTTVRRWPRSLPQYEVGHMERIAKLDTHIAALHGLTLLGNSYRGVGLPDLIRDAREAARKIAQA